MHNEQKDATLADKNYRTTGDWTVGELEEKLINFFKKHGPNAQIKIDSCIQRFQTDSVNYWTSKDYLEYSHEWNEDEILGKGLGQATALFYKLTSQGKKYVQRKIL